MKCYCGYPAFFYRAHSDDKKYNVYKCGHTNVESKKKMSCEMDFREFVGDIPGVFKETPTTEHIIQEKEDPIEKTKQEIRNYIYLCEITKYKTGNYIANINHLLGRLNFKLYFPERETLESLKTRIEDKHVPRVPKKNIFPVNIIEYPECFKIKQTKPRRKKVVKKQVKFNPVIARVVPRKPTEEILLSDAETDESEDEMDNTFDVDNYDSGEDMDDDEGAFSD